MNARPLNRRLSVAAVLLCMFYLQPLAAFGAFIEVLGSSIVSPPNTVTSTVAIPGPDSSVGGTIDALNGQLHVISGNVGLDASVAANQFTSIPSKFTADLWISGSSGPLTPTSAGGLTFIYARVKISPDPGESIGEPCHIVRILHASRTRCAERMVYQFPLFSFLPARDQYVSA